MIVVSDTSPLGSLALIDHLWLLQEVYGTVIIPDVVATELGVARDIRIRNVLSLDWVQVQSLTDKSTAVELQDNRRLDAGEAYAIALAIQFNADELLIDERLGRREAARLGLSVIGVLGVLITAQRRHLIPLVKPVMDALIEQAGFRISPGLYQRILTIADEN